MNLLYIRYAIIAMLVLQACGKSFLDAPPTDVLPREELVNDLDGCERLLRGTYVDLSKSFGIYSDIYPELVADNIKPINGAQNMIEAYTWSQRADESDIPDLKPGSVNMNGFSYRFYNIIRTANYIIEKTEEFRNEDVVKGDYLIGSALTIRAYSYFMLVNMFAQPYGYSPDASHPGVVHSNSSNWTDAITGRATVAEIYKNIIADLERAVPLFRDEPTTTIRYSKNLSKAILSRAYLAKGDYASSLKYAKDCMSKYSLLTIANGYPDDLYKKTTSSENEVIFHILPLSSASMAYAGGGQFSNQYYRRNPSLQFVATADLMQLLTENTNDVRKNWINLVGADWKVTKYPKGVIADVRPPELSYYQCIARVSEMYLNAAECSYQLQQEDDARNYITQIIQRADPSAPAVTATGQILLDIIRKERRKELAFEGFRLYDLQRWKLPIIRSDASPSQYSRLDLPNDKAIAPIPKQDLLGAGMIQNPGY